MNTKDLAAVAIFAAIIGGITGAIFASIFSSTELPEKAKFKEVEIESLNAGKVNAGEFISKSGDELSLSIKDGNILTTKSIVAGEIRCKRVLGNHIMAISNDPMATFDNCEVLAQIVAGPGGGVFYVHNKKGAYLPANGPVKQGNVIFMGYDQNGLPALFSQEVAQGEKGKLYLIKTTVKPKDADGKTEKDKNTRKK